MCPSCNTRRMVETAAHLTDHALPDLPLRQWVLVVPKRLRYFLQRDPELQGAALRLFLRAVEQCLRAHSAGAGPAARGRGLHPSSCRRYAWALLARIYAVLPLLCPRCGAKTRIIAFITGASAIRDILVHLGEPTAPPRIAPARGPPLWDLPDAETGSGDSHASAGAGGRVRSAPRLVTPIVDRQRATPGMDMRGTR